MSGHPDLSALHDLDDPMDVDHDLTFARTVSPSIPAAPPNSIEPSPQSEFASLCQDEDAVERFLNTFEDSLG